MKTHLILASLVTATTMTFALPAFAADTAQTFVDKAAAGGMFEVEFQQDRAGHGPGPGSQGFRPAR